MFSEMTKAVFKLVATTLIPGLELRASIPVGLLVLREEIRAVLGGAGVVGVCLVANVLLGMAVFEAMALVEKFLLRIGWLLYVGFILRMIRMFSTISGCGCSIRSSYTAELPSLKLTRTRSGFSLYSWS